MDTGKSTSHNNFSPKLTEMVAFTLIDNSGTNGFKIHLFSWEFLTVAIVLN